MKKTALYVALFGSTLSAAALAGPQGVSFDWLWTHHHVTTGQVSEIPAFDPLTNTLWIAGVVGVDVLDAATGELLQHIDVTERDGNPATHEGFVNSVAIHDGVAAFAIEAFSRAPSTNPPVAAAGNRRLPGTVLLYDTATRAPLDGINEIAVGSLPDMLTFTRDGSRLLVANEATPNQAADQPYQLAVGQDPPGTVSIIDMETRTLLTNAGLVGIATSGTRLRPASVVGMDYEPEYIAVGPTGQTAYVTLQEGNAIGVLDLQANVFTQIVGLGSKSFLAPGPQLDPCDTATPQPNCGPAATSFINANVNALYMPDSIAAYLWRGDTYLVMANEGDFREDNVDRVGANTLGAAAPINRLRVSGPDSSAGTPPTLYAAGARSFSIRDTDANVIYDSGDILDKQAALAGVYDDGRSRDKGMEPEGVALIDIRGETYAFIGLERTLQSAVAAFNISDPTDVDFLGLIVTPGGVAPEGLDAFQHNGNYYLAIAHETSNTTTLYQIDTVNPAGR